MSTNIIEQFCIQFRYLYCLWILLKRTCSSNTYTSANRDSLQHHVYSSTSSQRPLHSSQECNQALHGMCGKFTLFSVSNHQSKQITSTHDHHISLTRSTRFLWQVRPSPPWFIEVKQSTEKSSLVSFQLSQSRPHALTTSSGWFINICSLKIYFNSKTLLYCFQNRSSDRNIPQKYIKSLTKHDLAEVYIHPFHLQFVYCLFLPLQFGFNYSSGKRPSHHLLSHGAIQHAHTMRRFPHSMTHKSLCLVYETYSAHFS